MTQVDDKRRNNQLELALDGKAEGEARSPRTQGTEPSLAERPTERPAKATGLVEVMIRPDNVKKAAKRVMANKGAPGVDGMTTTELPAWLEANWPQVREQLLSGTYKPSPVRKVEIPKPNGGTRALGIPTALDRFIQQAVLQVMTPIFDPHFSEASYGFRPHRSAHQAVARAQGYVEEGKGWVVDLDIESFFDKVNHDVLMARVARKVDDKALLKLIRAFLNAGVMEGGLTTQRLEGTPQGGPLSPLLSNIYLDDLDQELTKRGHAFVRYADDCNIYVASERAGQRVMENVTQFLAKKLRLKVNQAKSGVLPASRGEFLSFGFTAGKPKRRIGKKAKQRLRRRVKEITRRTRGVSLEQVVADLNRYLRGWAGYFGFCQTPSVLRELDSWIRRRLRYLVWKQWKGDVPATQLSGPEAYPGTRPRSLPAVSAATGA